MLLWLLLLLVLVVWCWGKVWLNTALEFKFSKVGTIAGSYIVDGIIRRDAKARVIRDGVVIYDGEINTIAREKDQVKEVKQGIECGITIENFNDIKIVF